MNDRKPIYILIGLGVACLLLGLFYLLYEPLSSLIAVAVYNPVPAIAITLGLAFVIKLIVQTKVSGTKDTIAIFKWIAILLFVAAISYGIIMFFQGTRQYMFDAWKTNQPPQQRR